MIPAITFTAIGWRQSKIRPCGRCKRKLRPGIPETKESRVIWFGGRELMVACGTCIPAIMNEFAGEFEKWTMPPEPKKQLVDWTMPDGTILKLELLWGPK